MATHALSAMLLALPLVAAQATGLNWAPTPLVSLHFPAPSNLPEKIWPDEPAYTRGPQSGYNICNSTTEGDSSLCQTMYMNGLDDFCLWAPAKLDSIANQEGDVVAFCAKTGYGTRQMKAGTLLGAQLLKSKDYWMITGLIDQTKLNIIAGDFGGELDSGSQDGRGNPIGGAVYSTAFNTSASDYQVPWWTEFIGNGQFCLKICNPAGSNEAGFCQHTLDRIGLGYNCPSKYTVGGGMQPGEFEVCDTDDMGVPGVYTDAGGATQSYAQPPESLGQITTIPYQPTTVASRNCVQTASSVLFANLPAATGGSGTTSGSAGMVTSTAKSGASTGTIKPTGSGSGSAASPSSTSSGAGASVVVGTAFSALVAVVAGLAIL